MEITRHASGVAKAGLTTGIIGTSLGTLGLLGAGANGLGTLLGGNKIAPATSMMEGMLMGALLNNGSGCCIPQNACCHEDHYVTRYDAEKDARIAKLESDIALRDANTFADQKVADLYARIDARIRGVEAQIAQQAVVNESIAGQIALAKQESQCCCDKLSMAIKAEEKARCCADNAIVNYVNATFYPQMISDLTIGTTAKPQATWNPLPNCGCDCGSNP